MIISMSDILCVTNRKLCRADFPTRIEQIAAAHPAGIILREKDLPEADYAFLAGKVLASCRTQGTPCILHSFHGTAIRLGCRKIHLPLPVLRTLSDEEKAFFTDIGSSCHSIEDARLAVQLGCTYITAGHIFDTDCKKGLPGRGILFLKDLCDSVSIPVYAIGGITADNISSVRNAGAAGACIMSGLMTCKDPAGFIRSCKEACRPPAHEKSYN